MVEQISKDEVMVRDILSSARRLFAQNGLKKTTMEDIANAMGKGKSTLYYYFSNKAQIFEVVVEEEMKNLLRSIRQAINLASTAKDKLKAYSKTRAIALQKLLNLSAVVYEEIFNSIGEIVRLKQKHEEIQIDLITEIIQGGIQSGEFKEMADENIRLFSCTLVAAFRGLELPFAHSLAFKKCENGPDILVDIMVDGIKRQA